MPKKRDALVVISTDLAQQWATRVNRHIGEAVAAIFATGRELIAAKAALHHGGWERMFTRHPQAVQEPVPFTVRSAQMYMTIAERVLLAQAKHVSLLPPSWGTLYALAKLPDETLTAAFDDGRIHPAMERREVRALRGAVIPESPPWTPEDGARRVVDVLDRESDRATTREERALFAALIYQRLQPMLGERRPR